MAHFSVVVYDFESVGNENWRNYDKPFNGEWCDFEELAATDPKRTQIPDLNSKIVYYPGLAAQNPKEYFAKETVWQLIALANGTTVSS